MLALLKSLLHYSCAVGRETGRAVTDTEKDFNCKTQLQYTNKNSHCWTQTLQHLAIKDKPD